MFFQNPIHCIIICWTRDRIGVTPLKPHRPLLEAFMHILLFFRRKLQRIHLQKSFGTTVCMVTQFLLFCLTVILLFLFSTCLRTVAWRTYSVIWSTTNSPPSSPRSWKFSNPPSQPAVSRCVFFMPPINQIDQISDRSLSPSLCRLYPFPCGGGVSVGL